MGNIGKSLTGEIRNILYFCWGHRLPSCLLESVQSQTPGRKEESHWPLPQGAGLPLGTGGLSSWMEARRGDREGMSLLSFQVNKPGTFCSVLTSPFPHLLLLCPPHKHYSASVAYLSKWITWDKKNLKPIFSKHSWLDTWTWADIRLIASPQHTLRVTVFSWSSMGRKLPWESLFRNLISNYSLSMIGSKKKTLCIYLPGESYEKCLNIKEQQIIENSCYNNEMESSIL